MIDHFSNTFRMFTVSAQKYGLNSEALQYARDILQAIDTICNRNKIEYFIYSGTLLGQFRHEGMIPWNDGFNLVMKDEHKHKFIEAVKKEVRNSGHVDPPDHG